MILKATKEAASIKLDSEIYTSLLGAKYDQDEKVRNDMDDLSH